MKCKIFNIDNIISVSSFTVGCAIGMLILKFLDGISINKFLFCVICGIVLSGLIRIFFPYSRTDTEKRRKIDLICGEINHSAFKNHTVYRIKLKKIVRLYHNNQFQRALKTADRLYSHIESDEDRFAVCYWTALCCFELRFFEDARDEFLGCLSIRYDENAEADLADCYIYLEEYGNAAKCFHVLLEKHSNNYLYICGAALCSYKLKSYDDTLKYAKRAIDICAEDIRAYIIYLFSLKCIDNFDFELYLKYLEKAKNIDKNLLEKYPELMPD